jgi:hypothetical protein
MKRWIAFSLALCMTLSLSACGGYLLDENGLPVLPGWRRSGLNKALQGYDERLDFPETVMNNWGHGEGNDWIRYYGTFEGYDIVFYCWMSAISMPSYIISCGQMFECSNDCVLVGVKDGVVYDLNELYKKGEISRESGAKIHEYHELYGKLSRGDAS